MAKKSHLIENANLSPIERAAVLLISLESEMPGLTNNVFSHMGEEKSKLLLKTIASLGKVGPDTIGAVLDEFFSMAIEHKFVFGGADVSHRIMKDTFGVTEQSEFYSEEARFFTYFETAPIPTILTFFETESRQFLVLVLNHLSPERMSDLMSEMDLSLAQEITQLLLEIDVPNHHLVWELDQAVGKMFTDSVSTQVQPGDEQVKKMSRVLEMVSPTVRTGVLDMLESTNQTVLDQLKGMIFTFADLEHISDRDMETIIYEVTDLRQLAFALVDASSQLVQKVEENVSDRVKVMLDEERQTLPDALDQDEVEKARRQVLKLARRLEANRQIQPLRAGSESTDNLEELEASPLPESEDKGEE